MLVDRDKHDWDQVSALQRWALGALVAWPAIVLVSAVRIGAGLQGDSIRYLASAEALANRWGSVGIVAWFMDSAPGFVHWPLGYPMWLSVGPIAGMPLPLWGFITNCLFASLLVWLTYWLGRIALGRPRPALLAATFVAISPAMVEVNWRLQSEPLFTVLFMGVVAVLASAIRGAKLSWPAICLIAVLASGATMVRYMGLFLLPLVFAGAVLAVRREPRARAIALVLVTMLGSLIGVVLQGLRNLSFGSGFLSDSRGLERFTIPDLLTQSVPWIGSYLLPLRVTVVSGLVAGAILMLFAWHATWMARERNWTVVFLYVVWAGFWGMLLLSIYAQDTSPIDWRFIHPVFGTFCILLIASATRAVKQMAQMDGVRRLITGYPWMPPAAIWGSRVLLGVLLVVMLSRTLAMAVNPLGSGATSVIPLL